MHSSTYNQPKPPHPPASIRRHKNNPGKGTFFTTIGLHLVFLLLHYKDQQGDDYFIVLGIRAPGHRSENVLILQHRIWAWEQPRERLKKALSWNYGFRNCRGILSYDLRNHRGNKLSVTTAEASETELPLQEMQRNWSLRNCRVIEIRLQKLQRNTATDSKLQWNSAPAL